MKLIALTKGAFAMVDDADYEALASRHWHLFAKGHLLYARTNEGPTGNQRSVWMHRLLIDAPPGLEVDHIDGNPLNNQRANLRLATHQENLFNQRKKRGTTSRFKGVTWCKRHCKWLAQIQRDGRNKFLGYFVVEEEAAKAYDSAARQLFGEFARPNFGS